MVFEAVSVYNEKLFILTFGWFILKPYSVGPHTVFQISHLMCCLQRWLIRILIHIFPVLYSCLHSAI